MVEHAQEQAARDVDKQDDHAGDGIAADELAGTVHRAEEVGLAIDLLAPLVRLVLVDEPGVQVGVDGHLPAGQAVEHEPRGDLADPGRAPGDHHELDHHQDREQDHAHQHLVAGDELAERANHAAGRVQPVLTATREDQPGRRHVQDQPGQGRGQEDGRKCAEFLGRADRQRREQDHHRQRQVAPRAERRAAPAESE